MVLLSCSRSPLDFSTGKDNLDDLPAALWLDADAHKTDTDFSDGLKDLSRSGRNCFSDIYPKIEFELPAQVPVFKNSRDNYLNCKNMELSLLSDGRFSVVMVFVPRNGTTLLSVKDNSDEVLGIYWLKKEGFIVQTGTGANVLSQKTTTVAPDDQLAVLKFTYNKDEPLNAEKQELWINGQQVSLSPVTPALENSGEITNSTSALTVKASTATEISSLFMFDGSLSEPDSNKLDCYLRERFNLSFLNCI